MKRIFIVWISWIKTTNVRLILYLNAIHNRTHTHIHCTTFLVCQRINKFRMALPPFIERKRRTETTQVVHKIMCSVYLFPSVYCFSLLWGRERSSELSVLIWNESMMLCVVDAYVGVCVCVWRKYSKSIRLTHTLIFMLNKFSTEIRISRCVSLFCMASSYLLILFVLSALFFFFY